MILQFIIGKFNDDGTKIFASVYDTFDAATVYDAKKYDLIDDAMAFLDSLPAGDGIIYCIDEVYTNNAVPM